LENIPDRFAAANRPDFAGLAGHPNYTRPELAG